MPPRIIEYAETAPKLSWTDAVDALRAGHLHPRAQMQDMFLGPAGASLLSRGAYIDGVGFGVKSVTVFGDNPKSDLPSIQGAMLVFEPVHGQLDAIIDSALITEFKTAADSVLGAKLLARPDCRSLLIVGAGSVARSLVAAYGANFPGLERVAVWSRRPEQARALARDLTRGGAPVTATEDLPAAVGCADIIATCTMAADPVLRGDWVTPGTHVDLIGAFRSDMRESDDALLRRGTLFVDSRETTIHHIGELTIPIANGTIVEDDIRADFYDLIAGNHAGRADADQITVFKNGGGAHLDLMMAGYICRAG